MKERQYAIRDPIHGLIELSNKEVDLINTRVFQRLRRIRQLALAFLVYPGTLHTRFDHSIGVMHIAGQICNRLQQPDLKTEITNEDCKRIRLAALLHDVGHGPFSHVSEHLLERYAPDQASVGQTREKIHEKVTVDIINQDPEIGEILTPDDREFVIEIISGKATRDFRRDIVSSDLDADKMDYLLRDSYFAGVKYGVYDLEKIIDSCRISRGGSESFLTISDEGIYALEQLLLAKHHMTQQVYRHRVRLISDAMIIRGIILAIREGNPEIENLYRYKKTPAFINNYLEYHDERLIDILKRCDQENARQIFERLYERRLFKLISDLPLREVSDAIARGRLSKMEDREQQQWEEQIASALRIDPDWVIVNKIQVRDPNYGGQSYSLNPEKILVFDEKRGHPRELSEYPSELVTTRSPSNENAQTIQVYAPRDHWNTLSKEQRQQEQSQLDTEVREILLSP